MANLELEHKDLERKFEEARTIWRNSMDRLEKDNKELKAEVQRLKQRVEELEEQEAEDNIQRGIKQGK